MGEQSAAHADRLKWVDAAKGVGIILVVAGHVWTRGPVRDAIYAFHMPLFFLLSGYLVRPAPMRRLIEAQARTLLVPFAVFSLLLVAADFAIEGARGVRPIFAGWGEAAYTILLRTDLLRGPFGILWFVPCLFLARLLWNTLATRWPQPVAPVWPAVVLVLLGSAWLIGPGVPSPFGIAALPAALALFWVGQLWRRAPAISSGAAFVIVVAALALLPFLPPLNLRGGDYAVPILSLAAATLVSIALCLALMRQRPPLLAALAWVGRASLVIMFVHIAFIHYLAPYLPKAALFGIALAGGAIIQRAAGVTRVGRVLLLGQWKPEA